jgi:threonine aldolase
MRTIPNQPDGTIKIDSIVNAIRANNIHYPVTRLVCLENTQNYCGGRLLPKEYLTQLSEELRKHKIPLHIDGARIWNASVASNLSVAEITKEADSVSVCMSKGLGAPCGSLLVGGREWIEAARRIRKALGGGMRQVGVLAAACHVALDDFETGVLRADHERVTRLATALSGLPRLQVHPQDVDSNILVVHVEPFAAADGTVVDANTISGLLKDKGILCIARNPTSIRLVTHRDLTEMDIDSAIDAFKLICAAF